MKYRFMRLLFDTEGGEGDNSSNGDNSNGNENGNGGTNGTDGGSGTDDGSKGGKSGDDNSGKGNSGKGDEKKYSDADLDRIINRKFAAWQQKQQEAVDEAAKLAKMDAQQKAEYERDKLQAELNELKEANSRAQMTITARNILQEKGVSVSDAIVSHLIGKDAESTKEAVDSFAEAFQQAVTDAVKDLNKKKTPKAGGSSTVTREEIMKIDDRLERQAMIREHPEVFRK